MNVARSAAVEQLLVELAAWWTGVDAELLGEKESEVFVGTERLSGVAFGGQRPHEEAMSALAKRRKLDEGAAGVAGGG